MIPDNPKKARIRPRHIASLVIAAVSWTLLLGECSRGLSPEGRVSISDFSEVTNTIGGGTVKVLRLRSDGATEKVPLATGLLVMREKRGRGYRILVVTRLTSVQNRGALAVCYSPFLCDDTSRRCTAASAKIFGRDEGRDLALLEALTAGEMFLCETVTLGSSEYTAGMGVLCSGFVRGRNLMGDWYGKSTTLVTKVRRVVQQGEARGEALPDTVLVEVADSAPLDPHGVLSGAPVIDTSGTTIGMWVDRAPYSRHFLPAREIERFLDRYGVRRD